MPREKMRSQGVRALNDRELIALLLGTGYGGKNVMALSRDILKFIEERDYVFGWDEIGRVKGIGAARASLLMAVFEIVRRHSTGNSVKVTNPETVQKILFHYADRPREHFFVLSLNGAHELIKRHIVSTGNMNRVYIHPRDVFSEAVGDRAAALIVAHNHPSGSLEPSPEDIAMTQKLKKVACLLEIPLLDHVIFSRKGFYSFMKEENF